VSLSDRLDSIDARPSFTGCTTCQWLDTLELPDRKAFDNWLTEGKSKTALWQACVNNDDKPLSITFTPFRDHLRHHKPIA
jgi:hypothetical protein